MKMNKKSLICYVVAAAALAGCATTRQSAPVVDRTPVKAAEPPKPRAVDKRGFYTVKRGDTLYRIAIEFGQNFRDLVAWNNLSSPNDIKVDQVLRVLPPDNLQDGAQTGGISSSSGVEVRPLGSAPAASAVNNKSGPRGDKQPYSDATLNEMQKSEGSVPEIGKTLPLPAEGTPQTPPVVDDGVGWVWPAEGKLIEAFTAGKKGIDIGGKLGDPIAAAGSGTVLYAGRMRGYGNLVIVKHTSNLLSAYAHCKTILVKEGQTVTRGQNIAEMGNSDADRVKLHFEIRQQGKPVDPTKFLPPR